MHVCLSTPIGLIYLFMGDYKIKMIEFPDDVGFKFLVVKACPKIPKR